MFKGLLTVAIIIAVMGSISPIFWLIAIGLIIFVANQKKSGKTDADKAEYEHRKAEWERQRNLKKTADTKTSREECARRRKAWEEQHIAGTNSQKTQTGSNRKSYTPGVYDQSYTASHILPKPLVRRNVLLQILITSML